MLSMLLVLLDDESDKEFFTEIFMSFQGQMWKTAASVLKDDYLAEDAVQNAFIRIAKNLDTVRSLDGDLRRAYMLTAAKHAAIDLIKKSREINCEMIFKAKSKFSNDEIESLEETDFIVHILNKMSPIYRDFLYYYLVLGITEKEISKILELNINTVRQRISRGRKKFTELYEEEMEKIESSKV